MIKMGVEREKGLVEHEKVLVAREKELYELFCAETGNLVTHEWRYVLTSQEAELVAKWDMGYCAGLLRICRQLPEY